jgi:phage terminase small subunit
MKTPNNRREKFVAEYVKDGNATKAAVRAGYSAKSARVTGHRLLTNAALQQRLKEAGQQGLETLMEIAESGKSETARVQAATVLMDRAWGRVITPVEIKPTLVKICIDLTGSGEVPPADVLDLDPDEYLEVNSST